MSFPIMGVVIPTICKRRIPLNRDGSVVDTGELNMDEEVGFYYVEPWVFEWLGHGWPLTKSYVRRTDTGELATPDFDVAG